MSSAKMKRLGALEQASGKDGLFLVVPDLLDPSEYPWIWEGAVASGQRVGVVRYPGLCDEERLAAFHAAKPDEGRCV